MKLRTWAAAVTCLVSSASVAEDRANLSLQDMITGFEQQRMFYFAMLLENQKYSKTFNKCLSSRPAATEWVKEHCKKNPEFTNAFQCTEGTMTQVWFVYDNKEQCESVREPMKDKMDAIK